MGAPSSSLVDKASVKWSSVLWLRRSWGHFSCDKAARILMPSKFWVLSAQNGVNELWVGLCSASCNRFRAALPLGREL